MSVPSRLPEGVESYLEANRAILVSTAETLIGHDTSNPPGHTATAAAWVASRLADGGVDVERIAVDPEKPNLVATVPGTSDRTLCFVGHLDTVPFDAADWSRDPLGERDDDRLYGRGASDMTGAVVAMVQVALAFAEADAKPPVDLQFAFVSDEETGGDAGLPSVRESIRNCLGGVEGVSIADVSWSRGSHEPIDSSLVEASAAAAESVVDGSVYRRSATGGGDAKSLRHDGIPTVELGFGTDTAHAVDVYTTVDALVRNAEAYSQLVGEYAARIDAGRSSEP